MSSKLFSPITIGGLTLKNRIVMSPMCMFMADEHDGFITDWHKFHYVARAMGGVGLIMLESTAVLPEGKIQKQDLGIWSDEHIKGLKELADIVHKNGSKIGIQISHAGRKAELDCIPVAPSSVAFDGMPAPIEVSKEQIHNIVEAFQLAAVRAKKAGFDAIELHGAHGFLINQFLSPLVNKRTDEYGGNPQNRYRFLKEIIDAVNLVWDGPLFVRISANEYNEKGNKIEQYVEYAKWMKEQGVDVIDCSSGGVVPAKIDLYPGYQVDLANQVKSQADILTGAVGLITDPNHAEEIIKKNQADLIFLGRELLRNPYWTFTAAQKLHTEIPTPRQYEMAFRHFFNS